MARDINENLFREKVLGSQLSGVDQSRAAADRLRQDKMEEASRKRTEGQAAGTRRGLRMPETGSGKSGSMEREKESEAGEEEPKSLRERVMDAKRERESAKAEKEASEEKSSGARGYFAKKIKNKIYSSIPGFNLVWALWRFLSGKKLKLDMGDIFLMSFSSLTTLFVVLSGLGLMAMVLGWMMDPLKAIADLGWGAIASLVSLFGSIFMVSSGVD
ncbi:MAG: hypothetical protein WC745_05205 [Patescibacteria group bacterium]|jgi:hypothetical protein